jgi:hypothetical protein
MLSPRHQPFVQVKGGPLLVGNLRVGASCYRMMIHAANLLGAAIFVE